VQPMVRCRGPASTLWLGKVPSVAGSLPGKQAPANQALVVITTPSSLPTGFLTAFTNAPRQDSELEPEAGSLSQLDP